MASFHNWTGDEEIATQVPQFLNADNATTQERLDTKFNKTSEIVGASDLNSFRDEGFYCCNSNAHAETVLNCPTNYAFGLMVWGKDAIVYQELREFNRGTNQDYNNCWRRSYYSDNGQSMWSNWQQMSYAATTLAGYGITDGMSKNVQNSVSTENVMKRDVNNSYLRLMGGTGAGSGASLQLCGSALTGIEGFFSLIAVDSARSAILKGSPSGRLTWNNKNIVRSINNVAADDNGNVNITVGGSGSGGSIAVDAELSSTSTNPVQNKVIYNALLGKVGTDIYSGFALIGGGSSIVWRQGSQPLGSINATNYSGTALAATCDGQSNVITDTYAKKAELNSYVKTVNNVAPDDNGNVTITVSGGGGSSGGSNITVDAELSDTSKNPVQNKVVKAALDNRAVLDDTNTFTSPNTFDIIYMQKNVGSIRWYAGSQSVVVGHINAESYTGEANTAKKATIATKDGDGNIITDTYATKTELNSCVKTVNNVAPDSSGNVTIEVSGGGSNITVDAELSTTSTNAIQNKAVAKKFNDLTVAFDSKANIVDLADVATSGQYHDLKNTPTVDTTLSSTSTNAIANKAVYDALNKKLDKTGTVYEATKATQDGYGNVITSTYVKEVDLVSYVKTVNNIAPDANGNVNVNVSTGGGGVSTSVANTWTAQQNFQRLKFDFEKYATSRISGTYDSPSKSVVTYNVTGALTLDMSTLTGMLANGESTLFTAYIASNASYSLSITNAGTLKYVGSASDLAITSSGLLLNVLLTKNTSSDVTSIAQASKLS